MKVLSIRLVGLLRTVKPGVTLDYLLVVAFGFITAFANPLTALIGASPYASQ